jgi:glycosyltransferase involved in cell wall biosynthesis
MSLKLVVCIDIRDLRIAKTGTKTYLEEVCREFKKGKEGFTFFFIDSWIPVYTGNSKILKIIEHIRYFGWKQVSLPIICWFKKCDILFCTDYFLPLYKLKFKTAVVFHDAFFWEYPEHYNKHWLMFFKKIAVPAAKKADAVITVSQYAKERIHQYVGIQKSKIHVVHLAPKSSAIKYETGIPIINSLPKKYILHVGVLEKRKNLLNLIKAYNLLIQEGFDDLNLVLVGGQIKKSTMDESNNIDQLILDLNLSNKVIKKGYISDDQLYHYYRNASLYAFVSVNEGFGIPLLEAFHNQLPCIIANNSSLPEIAQGAAITCDPFDIIDIKNKLKQVLSNENLQKDLVQMGSNRLSDFSWEKTSFGLLSIFKEITD